MKANDVFRDQRGVFVVKENNTGNRTANRQMTTGEQILFGNRLRTNDKVWLPNDSKKTGKMANFANLNHQPEGPSETVKREPLKVWK